MYADFTKGYSLALGQLVEDIGGVAGKPAVPVDPLGGRVARLLAKIHEGQRPLSACIAEGLELARELGDTSLEAFCRCELSGVFTSGDREKDDDLAARFRWRVVEGYACTIGVINPSYVGFGTVSGLWSYIESRPDEFKPIRFWFNFALPEVEAQVRRVVPTTTAVTLSRPIDDFVARTSTPGVRVTIYLRPDVASKVVEAVRAEFAQRLLSLMPVVRPAETDSQQADPPPIGRSNKTER